MAAPNTKQVAAPLLLAALFHSAGLRLGSGTILVLLARAGTAAGRTATRAGTAAASAGTARAASPSAGATAAATATATGTSTAA